MIAEVLSTGATARLPPGGAVGHHVRVRAKAAFAALALLFVTGCTSSSDGGDSSSPPPTTPVSTPSSTVPTTPPTSPTPVVTPTVPPDVPTTGPNLLRKDEKPPVEPVAATKHTAAGAKSFAAFFVRTMDWGYATVSGSYMRHYSSPSCKSCKTLADQIDADRRAGHRYIGGRSTVVRVTAGPKGALRSEIVAVDSTSFEETTADGKFVTGDPAYRNLRYDISVTWASDRWLARDMAIVQ